MVAVIVPVIGTVPGAVRPVDRLVMVNRRGSPKVNVPDPSSAALKCCAIDIRHPQRRMRVEAAPFGARRAHRLRVPRAR